MKAISARVDLVVAGDDGHPIVRSCTRTNEPSGPELTAEQLAVAACRSLVGHAGWPTDAAARMSAADPHLLAALKELYSFTQAMRAAYGAPPEHEILAKARLAIAAAEAQP